MTDKEQVRISKMLSLVLRHKPETIGLTIDANGWADTQELLDKLKLHDHVLTMEGLKVIVAGNDKKRFAFSDDFSRIRASQGHSVEVDLALEEQVPPAILYHGTAMRNVDAIRAQGLLKGERHHVHLSEDKDTARNVGMRYGNPVVLAVQAALMHKQGIQFFRSANGVWLTDHVPPSFID